MDHTKPEGSAAIRPVPWRRIAIVFGVLSGLLGGLGGYTFIYAEGFSYMGSDPETCANCHIMRQQYDSWLRSSHHNAATCVDCHLPHDILGKYLAKSENGYHHSKGFTLQNFHEPIMIKSKNSRILQESCLSCHEDMVHDLVAGATSDADAVRCVHCHSSVGHGETTGVGGRDLGETLELLREAE